MARTENPPFGRGETFYGQSPNPAIDTSNLGGAQHEGKEWEFEDIDYTVQGAKTTRTNRTVRCRCVRNVSGIALLPKRLAKFKLTGATYGAQVDGYTTTTAERGYPVDEFLPAAGVANNDLFWIVVSGPAKVISPLAGADFGANNLFAVGDILVALTAITSQATTAGHATFQGFTGVTTQLDTYVANNIQNSIGRCLSATTSGQTNADVLVEVGHW